MRSGPFRIRWLSGWITPWWQVSISFAVEDYDIPAAGLQVIQTVHATRRADGQKVGQLELTIDGVRYDAFVDGGRFAPSVLLDGNEPSHPTKPYYYDQRQHALNVYSCHVRLFDHPYGVNLHQMIEFETAIVCRDFEENGVDRVIASYRWGWFGDGRNKTYSHPQPGVRDGIDFPDESSQASDTFKEIVAHDYPDYHFDEFP